MHLIELLIHQQAGTYDVQNNIGQISLTKVIVLELSRVITHLNQLSL